MRSLKARKYWPVVAVSGTLVFCALSFFATSSPMQETLVQGTFSPDATVSRIGDLHILALAPSDRTLNVQTAVIVAVIDAGVDFTHKDLQDVMWKSDYCVNGEGVPFINTCENGYDFVDNDFAPWPEDKDDHGTAVASIIGESSASRVSDSASERRLIEVMALRVSSDDSLQISHIVSAIDFAVANGARIINMSFSTPTYSHTLASAVLKAQQAGVIVVASGGNRGANLTRNPIYPASLPGVIAVGSHTDSNSVPAWSNFGNGIDVTAPGVGIYGATFHNGYRTYSGTSFSAALVTAFIARKFSDGLTNSEFFATLPTASTQSLVKVLPKSEAFAVATIRSARTSIREAPFLHQLSITSVSGSATLDGK